MHSHKIECFKAEHPGQDFPATRALAEHECAAMQQALTRNLALQCGDDKLAMLEEIQRRSTCIGHTDENGAFAPLPAILERHAKTPLLLLNWHQFDDIDEIAASDFVTYFEDIWWPPADESLEVFDASCSWLLVFTHWGDVRLLLSSEYGNARV